MAVVGSTFVELHVVSAGLEKEIAGKVQAAAKNAEKAAQITPKVNAAGAQNEANKLTGVMGALQNKLKSVAESGGPVSSSLAKIAQRAASIGPAAVVSTLALAALTAVVAHGISEFLDLAATIRRFEIASGASARTSTQFVIALKDLGVEPQKVSNALYRLAQSVKNGDDALNQFGIEVARTKDGQVDLTETFLNVSDAVSKTESAAKRAQIAQAAFSRQGRDLIPILTRGREGLADFLAAADRLHLTDVFTDEGLQRARDFQIEMRELHTSVEALEINLGSGLVPAISAVITRVTTGIEKLNDMTHAVGGLAGVAKAAGNSLRVGLAFATGGASEALIRFTNSNHAAAGSAERMQADAEREATSLSNLRDAVLGSIAAQDGLTGAKNAYISAQDTLASAQARVNDLTKRGAVDAGAVRSAQDGLTSSTRGLTSARQDLAKAEAELARAQQGATDRELERANLTVKEATNSLTRAEKDLADMRKKHRRDALGISEAENQVEEAQLALADAQDELTKTNEKGTDQDQDVIDAQERVAQARDSVTDAIRQQGSAAASLREAQRGDPAFSRELAEAQHALAAAKDGVTAAEHGVESAVIKSKTASDLLADSIGASAQAVADLRAEFQGLAADFGIPLPALLQALSGKGASATAAAGGLTPAQLATIFDPNNPANKKPKRAAGGPAESGYWYEINEQGTEFFKPNTSGTVIPIGSGAASAQGRAVVVEQHFHGTDPESTAQRSGYYVGRALRTSPR